MRPPLQYSWSGREIIGAIPVPSGPTGNTTVVAAGDAGIGFKLATVLVEDVIAGHTHQRGRRGPGGGPTLDVHVAARADLDPCAVNTDRARERIP